MAHGHSKGSVQDSMGSVNTLFHQDFRGGALVRRGFAIVDQTSVEPWYLI